MAYFFIIYSDIKEETRSGTSLSEESVNKELVVNPHCGMRLILEYICSETGVAIDSEFDICTPNVQCLNVKGYKDYVSGNTLFLSKAIYYIVMLDRDPDDFSIVLKPLLATKSKEYIKFMARILAPKIKSSKLKRKGSGSVSVSLTSGSKSTKTTSSKTGSIKTTTTTTTTTSSKTASSKTPSTKTGSSKASSMSSKKSQSQSAESKKSES